MVGHRRMLLKLEVYPERPDAWASYRLRRWRWPFRLLLGEYAHVVALHDWVRMLRERWITRTPEVNRAMYGFDLAPLAEPDWSVVAVNMLSHESVHQAICELAFRAGDGPEAALLLVKAENGLDALVAKYNVEWMDGAPWLEHER